MIDRIRLPQMELPGHIRIGAVSYLNSKPLIEGLCELVPAARLILDLPSRLADDLAAGQLDVALIPSVEAFADPDYEIVPDACVATRGPVLSVKLYSRVPPGMIRRLALDEGSRTSAALVRIILAERYGVTPQIQPLPMGQGTADSDADAVLLIGDRAMHAPSESFDTIWDLGEVWSEWTGLPFVFAMWVTRGGVELGSVGRALSQARDHGLSQLSHIAAREASGLGITHQLAADYLKHNLHFRLGPAERSGLKLFHDLASANGLAPSNSEIHFRETVPARIPRSPVAV
jgi:chorismate dehydratase